MKTKFFPLVAIVFAVAGAFAFNVKPEKSAVMDVNGYIPGSPCEETEVVCQTPNNGIFCTDASGTQLYELNAAGTACPNHLYRKL
ncbi:hypothetical protein B6A10_06210 [Flavobacterium sp. L1I52]|uniref:Uncharacterized protein n=1 Tax=Flavobacterium pokkalii TaxID=1940408 RepID=A0ABR7UQ55_9FLAO|nr:DUF6520 family protein [Flavobacterium pokkalii]MBD0724768.1 hypothetical protein [Flavobacterium pokkalii]